MSTDRNDFPLGHSEIFRLMVERSPLPISIQDSQWKFVYVNQAYCDFVGYDANELLGNDPSFFLFPSEAQAQIKSHREWANHRNFGEFSPLDRIRELVRRDGSRVRFRDYLGQSQTEDGEDLWCGILFELTELDQLRAEVSAFQDRSAAMQVRFDSFAELSNEGMLIVDVANDVVLHANSVVSEILGVELTGNEQPFNDLLALFEPSEVPGLRSTILRGSSRRGAETNVTLQHPNTGKRSIRVRSFKGRAPDTETFLLLEDVTEQIRFEEYRLNIEVMRRETVVKEIHHRINNQLHGVMTLLESALISSDSKQTAMNAAISRINAIASLNGLLTGISSEISVVDLVSQLASHVQTALSCQVNIEFADTQPGLKGISIDTDAVAVALAINDLLMHASSLARDDKVDVRIEARQAEILIQIYCACDASDGEFPDSDSAGFGLAKSLLDGTDSAIVMDRHSADQRLRIDLTLGAQTLGQVG